MTLPTTDQRRLAALESRVGDLEELLSTDRRQVSGRLDHLTGAVGDLSQEARAAGLDLRELRADTTQLRRRVARNELAMNRLLAHFGIPEPTNAEVDAVLDES